MRRLFVAILMLVVVVGAQAQLPNFFSHEGKYEEFYNAIKVDKSFTFVKEINSKSSHSIYSIWEGSYLDKVFTITIIYSELTNDIMSVRMTSDTISNAMGVFVDIVYKISSYIGDAEFEEKTAYWYNNDLFVSIDDDVEITIYFSNSVNKAIHERAVRKQQ